MAILVQNVIDRLSKNMGPAWKSTDTLKAGSPDAAVTGIAVTWSPTLDVLRKAVANKQNLILSLEPPYWNGRAPDAGGRGPAADPVNNATYKIKNDFITSHALNIFQIRDSWTSRAEDGQLRGLAKALGWEKYYKPRADSPPWSPGNDGFTLPPATFGQLVTAVKNQLKVRTMRCVGDPSIRVSTVALTHGYMLVPHMEKIFATWSPDVVVCGEPCEWEAGPWFMDQIASGQKKGMIVLGSEVSSEPGCGELAALVRGVVTEVPVAWIPAGEPFIPVPLS